MINLFYRAPTALLVLASFVSFVGCSSDAPESLHDLEHFVAEHWPTSLADAAAKLETRVELLQKGFEEKAFVELCDIVGWIPEIAADSDLSESDWMPINDASLTLSDRLLSKSKPSISEFATELIALQELVVRESEKLAKTAREKEEQAKAREGQ